MKIAIIGGGACGLFCAARLSNLINDKNISIDIIEKDKKVGRKILLTGNGKGNISNQNVSVDKYNDSFVLKALSSFSYEDLVNYFSSRGVLLTIDNEGRIYPRSETSNTILDTLRRDYSNFVNEYIETNVTKLEFKNKQIRILGTNFDKLYDYVVLATGSKASLNNVSNKYNLDLISSTGHTVSKLYPSLSPVFVKENIASLRGIRTKAKVQMTLDKTYETEGEVLFKDDSLSGICIFEMSTFYARNKITSNCKNVKIQLDLLKDYDSDSLLSLLKDMRTNLGKDEASLLLNGFFPKMLAKYILDATKINLKNRLIKDLTDQELLIIVQNIKNQMFNVDENKEASNCQVMVGGVNLDEVDANTFESKIHPNLYFGGEVLNIDGQCGGYNLHFAFASGNLIAESILRKLGE